MDPARVVLDCDTANEVDDQFAIAHALGVPEDAFEVRSVVPVHNTTAHGPGARDMYQEETERVVALCASDAPCIPGAERGPRVPRGRGAPGTADHHRHGTGDRRGVAGSGVT